VFLGDNGEGKTNIIEGISYLCLARSFFSASDKNLVMLGENSFSVSGKIIKENGIDYEILSQFDQELNRKSIEVNKEKIGRSSSMFGRFPVVMLAPDHSSVTAGPPVSRRQFIDFVISQSSKTYLDDLIEYRRILKQKNRILSDERLKQNGSYSTLETWNESLVSTGKGIIARRMVFLNEFQDLLAESYAQISGGREIPGLRYNPSFGLENEEPLEIEGAFRRALEKNSGYEKRLGHSLVGPHRDDYEFTIGGLELAKYASQGQHKTFLVALKLAEFRFLKEKCGETPILLLDDVLSELDDRRSQHLLETTAGYGQIFISSSDEHAIDWLKVASAKPRKFFIKNGEITGIENEN
jgi:DNA replication and repair protein RecF